ncbi:RNA polymerase sigma factor [Streptomyces cinerochromogenes]|uniref:RNA polymerase sigma factor n=1 Tax=Streptomyces cinerochromogenes TaxID=66422 RepID=UPI0036AE009C
MTVLKGDAEDYDGEAIPFSLSDILAEYDWAQDPPRWLYDTDTPLADFEAFHRQYRPWVTRFVGRLVAARRAGIDAEDVVQDAFEVVFRKWAKVGRMRNPRGYLWRVSYNRAQRLMDRASREVASAMEPGFLELTDWALGWERSPQEVVMAKALGQLLKSLPRRQAQVLLLTADGWTDTQIGKALGCSPGTVRSHRRHLQNRCRQQVEQDRGAWSELLGTAR